MSVEIKKGLLLKCIAVPLAVGVIASLLTGGGMEAFASLNKPPLSPPGWLFPVVWTILYILMGVASYLVLVQEGDGGQKREAIFLYGLQLAVNFLWPIVFFNLEWYLFAFVWLILLWVLVAATLVRFYQISKVAGYLMVPYLLWLTFAAYLNLGIWILN